MVRPWRRDQATILFWQASELDERVMEWFSQQRDQIFHLQCEMRRIFAKLSEIVFQRVGSKESDWWSEIRCCHDNFKACHIKSTAVTEFTVISH